MKDLFSAGSTVGEPYWWAAKVGGVQQSEIIGQTFDVAVVGSGFTGVTAAIELATAGQTVLVLEAESIGYGASTRNGGMITAMLGVSPESLARRVGQDAADGMFTETAQLVPFLHRQITRFGIDCDFANVDHFTGAITRKHYRALEAAIPQLERYGMRFEMVPQGRERRFVASDAYKGGRAHLGCASVHPAKYHAGLVQTAVSAGVRFRESCRVADIQRSGSTFRLATAHGTALARQVIVATNGYTSGGLPWFRRRVIPIQSSIIATEPLGRARVGELFPNGTIVGDTNRILSYFRPSPDGTRMLYGGRASFAPISQTETARRLHVMMTRVFPELKAVRLTHSWSGYVAFTFDRLPHAGQHDGIHYAMGYCGSGVAMGSWLGYRTALQMLGTSEPSAFARSDLQTRAMYSGDPWMLPAIGEYYRARDWLDRQLDNVSKH